MAMTHEEQVQISELLAELVVGIGAVWDYAPGPAPDMREKVRRVLNLLGVSDRARGEEGENTWAREPCSGPGEEKLPPGSGEAPADLQIEVAAAMLRLLAGQTPREEPDGAHR